MNMLHDGVQHIGVALRRDTVTEVENVTGVLRVTCKNFICCCKSWLDAFKDTIGIQVSLEHNICT
jgi:glycine/D-amino acid oxidase-like deaminating enzyme